MTNCSSVYKTIEELQADIERLQRDNADLRASALLWKRLYEQLLPPEVTTEVEREAIAYTQQRSEASSPGMSTR